LKKEEINVRNVNTKKVNVNMVKKIIDVYSVMEVSYVFIKVEKILVKNVKEMVYASIIKEKQDV